MRRIPRAAGVAAVLAVLALAGCGSSGHSARPLTTGPAGVTPTPPPATDASTPRAIAGTARTPTPVVSPTADTVALQTADPANYHVGSVDPGGVRHIDENQVWFRTPSHNISCTVIAGDELTCETAQRSYQPAARPTSCQHNWLGSDVRLDAAGATLGVCAGDPQVLSGSTVLPYGYRLTTGRITCTSTSVALLCTDGAHGFRLDRTAAVLH